MASGSYRIDFTKEDIEKLVASPVEAEAVPVEVKQEEVVKTNDVEKIDAVE